MKPPIRLAAGVAAVAAATGAVVLGAAGAPAQSGSAAQAQKVSHRGVGQVHIGMRYAKARDMGLVGTLKEGCPFDDARAAKLKPPLEGSVEVPRETGRIRHITILGGAKARGVRVGSPLSAVTAAFPGAEVRKVTEFGGFTYVHVPKAAGGRFDFLLRPGGKQRVRSIEVRRFFVCD